MSVIAASVDVRERRFFSLAAATLLLAWLLRVALAEASASHPTPEGGSR
jgi:hypothetical protein